jgi:carbonic anhydrase
MNYKSIQQLIANNQTWVAEQLKKDPGYFEELASGQTPAYLYIGCSDSRLPLTQYLKADPGELFVHRNIANQVSLTDINFLAILEYAVTHLQVKHIIVCGHTNCGGIQAALMGLGIGIVDNWVNPIREIYLQNRSQINNLATDEMRINHLSELNIIAQVKNLYQTSVIRQALRSGDAPQIHGWLININTGLIKNLDVATLQWSANP